MSKTVRVEDEANAEIDDAARWYEARQPGLGHRYLQAVDITLQHIVTAPKAGAPAPRVAAELGVRRAPVKGFPHSIVYLERTHEIHVIAVVHDRRRPGYWLSRL